MLRHSNAEFWHRAGGEYIEHNETLACTGLLFLLYPVVRPWHDESTIRGTVTSMSSNAWVAAHLFAIFALILMPLGLLGLCRLVVSDRGFGLCVAATVIIWFGAGLALPYYGAEDFALHAVARQVRFGPLSTCLVWSKRSRFGTAAATSFAAGLVLLGVGGVLIAIAVWLTAILPRLSGMPLAIDHGQRRRSGGCHSQSRSAQSSSLRPIQRFVELACAGGEHLKRTREAARITLSSRDIRIPQLEQRLDTLLACTDIPPLREPYPRHTSP